MYRIECLLCNRFESNDLVAVQEHQHDEHNVDYMDLRKVRLNGSRPTTNLVGGPMVWSLDGNDIMRATKLEEAK